MKNVDILFPVDELQIVNYNILKDADPVSEDIYGFGSDLISSSNLFNENFFGFNVIESSQNQANKKKWFFKQPKIFSGAYKLFVKKMLADTTYDLSALNGEMVFHFLFIQYETESRTK
jgi:hypothetical protein